MINYGLEKYSEKNNVLNVLNYLYLCQNKEILYEKIDNGKDDNQTSFLDRLDQQFKDSKNRNKEIIDKIIEINKTLFFVNLIKDKKHKEIFGMNKVSKKVREILNYISRRNIEFLNDKKNANEENIEKLNKKIKNLKEELEEKKELKNFTEADNDINQIRRNNFEKDKESLNKSDLESKELEKRNLKFMEKTRFTKSKRANIYVF